MSSTSHFQIHTPLLAMMPSGPKETYVTLAVGTVAAIIDGPDTLNHPGLVTMLVNGETLYTFARDLELNAFIKPQVYGASELSPVWHGTLQKLRRQPDSCCDMNG